MDLRPFEPFLGALGDSRLARWRGVLADGIRTRLDTRRHGDLPHWESALAALPSPPRGQLCLAEDCVGIAGPVALPEPVLEDLVKQLMALHPWRKGPFCVHGLRIDAEWRSDLKWRRLKDAITPLAGRLVLDVGCGNGYYAWRMLGQGARLVIGVDPSLLCVAQWLAIDHFLGRDAMAVLPLGIEDLMALADAHLDDPGVFDTVFSMGVLAHRRAPLDHLRDLRRLLRPGGELVLETLVLAHQTDQVLVPTGRYAAMRNVWSIPTVGVLVGWLRGCGLTEVRVVDVSPTTPDEQRATPWMRFQSLVDQLDPLEPQRTREGYPAPVRAILIAYRPD
ncbi:tRNA 5-methoxyuridine(34)/uridine 5-oxyacetic acid(34) synthase CmoB [Thiocapsa imhoffii]|uniref:tRNA U34 carboxymethyltransferase n=1 Tax=Thiocapsa imhoffii TaxID=382777 RepID=A0A9X0WJT2_9GAMM|nr:tRNA 5-methoxyuridine(34)/uridine 5-oxyacetic acid(34) synthase CmoB [Thiocapsa imhoffii]MBK1646019.1 tRNA 5-methoxyuridine(34)/uridine 5-oxyacetic acid(34) synthase CmoB [Thiocapsa imhoffii]